MSHQPFTKPSILSLVLLLFFLGIFTAPACGQQVGDRVVASFAHSLPILPQDDQEYNDNNQELAMQMGTILATAAYGKELEQTEGLQLSIEQTQSTNTDTCPVSLTAETGFQTGYETLFCQRQRTPL